MSNLINHTSHFPCWIWHPERDGKRAFSLSKTMELTHDVEGISLHLALTGRAVVKLDGVMVCVVEENTGNVAAFRRIDTFPARLEAGSHTLALEITVSDIVPIADVNSYLINRRVGVAAFVSGTDYNLATDSTWMADDAPAVLICRLGEEPFGDLDNGLDSFVAGGYGDIAVERLADWTILACSSAEFLTEPDGSLAFRGVCHADGPRLPQPVRDQLYLFYHLRKQAEWKALRIFQKEADLSGFATVTIDLHLEYNVRFRVRNLSNCEYSLLWNGAESLYELEKYDGCITEEVKLAPQQSSTVLPQGMRYVRFTVLGAAGSAFAGAIEFEKVEAVLEQVGDVRTDLPLLDRIYEVSAHTNRICHQIGLWDGVKRDRLNWTLDFYLAAKSAYFLWDHAEVLKRSIREVGEGTPYGYWINGIPDYTCWWIAALGEYYFHTGDRSFVMALREPLLKHVRWIEESFDQGTGHLGNYHVSLIEWVPLTKQETTISLLAIVRMAKRQLEALLEAVPELAFTFHWPIATIPEQEYVQAKPLVTQLLGITSGYVGEEKAKEILQRYRLQDPCTPLSAFMLAECYSQYEMHDEAWQVISLVWGNMLKEGATTFWESFTLDYDTDFHDALTTYRDYSSYRMSLCHAWSSTPVKWITEYVLGVKALEPGFASIEFNPIPMNGMTSCHGSVPTPHGVIKAQWQIGKDGVIGKEIELPKGITMSERNIVC